MREDPFRVAAVSFPAQPGDVPGNLERIREYCAQAAHEKVELVLFPELSTSGFLPNHPTREHEPWLNEGIRWVRNLAETIPGPTTNQLIQIAREFNLFLSTGLFEDNGPLVHNVQVLVGPHGLESVTRKMHIPMFEAPFYNGGGPPEVREISVGRVGTLICFDTLLPESGRLLQVQKADLVLMPFASDPEPRTVEGWISNNEMLLRTRCLENGFFALVCNYRGPVEALGESMVFPGGGMLIGPRGQMLQRWPGESEPMMLAEIDPRLLQEARAHPEFGPRFRRPELYTALSEPLA